MGRRGGCGGAVVILVLAGVVLSLLLPAVAGGLVGLGLEAAGLRAEELSVRVEANPPLRLLAGRADRVVVEGTSVRWDGTTADALAVTLDDVDLFARRAGSVDGRLEGVEATGPVGTLVIARVEIAGPGDGPTTRLFVTPAETTRVVLALARGVGLVEGRVVLAPPDRVELDVAGRRLTARVAVVDGSVVVEGGGLPRLVVLEAGAASGLEIRSVVIGTDGGLVVEGRLDPGRLGLAG